MSKTFNILLLVYVGLVIADFISSIGQGQLFGFLEANLLFHSIGIIGIIIFNIAVIIFFYYVYHKCNVHLRFYIVLMLVTLLYIRSCVIYTNIVIWLHPPTLEQAAQITTAVKHSIASRMVLSGLIPYAIGAVGFFLYSIDHSIIRKLKMDVKNKK